MGLFEGKSIFDTTSWPDNIRKKNCGRG